MVTKLAPLFKTLSDANRLKILNFVHKRQLKCTDRDCACMKDISKKLDIGMPTISHHVKGLVQAGLLTVRKQGRWSYLEVEPKQFEKLEKFITLFT